MKKLLFLAVLLGLTGCGETDQNDTSQSTLQSSPASFNYYKATSARTISAPVASFGQWVVNGYTSEGASTVLNANRIIGGVSTESKALITPNVSQVSKILRAGLGGGALTFAVNELLDGIDWVMDPANNQIKYKIDSTQISTLTSLCKNLDWVKNNSDLINISSVTAVLEANNNFSCKAIFNYSGQYGYIAGFIPIPNEEKTLPFDEVSQKIIDNAESGNTDAQAVTLAAAQAIVSEAENDATKAKEIEDELERNSEKCPNGESRNIYGQCWICPQEYKQPIESNKNIAKVRAQALGSCLTGGRNKVFKNLDKDEFLVRSTAWDTLAEAREAENMCWLPPHANHVQEAQTNRGIAETCRAGAAQAIK
ncbi:hypothetical protein ABIC56_002966 [Acinetobacter bereziniae]|uniref:hypothetical protein n=1 Tax=Acinetobacter bereziniae TaxID=106648 RepID=UPI00285C5321|nr:hypothetical protein [Acinetobacter bereziniae]MDR6542991.1 hypothetical protein [Acinetobacter bereziniae]